MAIRAVAFDIGGVLEITRTLVSPSCGRPDPRIYALICARLDLRAHETVFLDDKDLCVYGAGEAGIHAVATRTTPGPSTRSRSCSQTLKCAHRPKPQTRKPPAKPRVRPPGATVPATGMSHCPRATRSAADPDGAG